MWTKLLKIGWWRLESHFSGSGTEANCGEIHNKWRTAINPRSTPRTPLRVPQVSSLQDTSYLPSVKVNVHMPQHKRLWAELASMEELQGGNHCSERKHSPGKHLLNPKIIFCGLLNVFNKMKRGGPNSLLPWSQGIGFIALIVAKSHQTSERI